MGSSRKHREKDRESRKRRHRSHSRSKSKERERLSDQRGGHSSTSSSKHSTKERRNRSRSRERERKRHRIEYPDKSRVKDDAREDSGDEGGVGSGGAADLSLSIEETNKLRAKLGLKPLEVNDGTGEKTNDEEKKDEFVHKPAENMSDRIQLEKLREKIAMLKEKRKISHKLGKVKGLGDSDSEPEDAQTWVVKNRLTEDDRKKAQERAKLLEELDAEFDLGNIVEDEMNMLKAKAYSDRDLKGLKVEHDEKTFAEGKTVILTLKDHGVLEDENDVLINVNMVDDEKTKKNNEIKKKSKIYNPMSDEEDDEDDDRDTRNVLSKYNEEIEGVKKKSFTIGGYRGTSSEVKMKKEDGGLSLHLPAPKLASEFYTEEEMVQFKKSSKKVRKVKKKKLRADDLLALQPVQQTKKSTADLGSRSRGRPVEQEEVEKKVVKKEQVSQFVRAESPDILGPDEDLTGVAVEEDEAEEELQFMLNKTRKLRQKEELKSGADKVVKSLSSFSTNSEDGKEVGGKGFIVLNDTAEFCRVLGDIPTYGLSGNRDEEDVDELMDFEREPVEEKMPIMEDNSNKGSWNEVDLTSKPEEVKIEDVTILEEEPDVSVGIAGALQLAMKKGYLDKETKKMVSAPRHSQLEAKAYTIEDKAVLDDDRLGRRDRFAAGPVSDFKEKDGYRPDIKLEYIDDSGRLLCPKEAFRHLSHKFHGKGSGKNKTEKKLKKLQEETLMKQMSSTDTPLGTLSLLQQKQRQTQSAYVVLSGGNKSINWSSISKK